VTASLTRAGLTYARGTARGLAVATRLRLHRLRPLKHGRYRLVVRIADPRGRTRTLVHAVRI
jgi:hypothetical protein